MRKFLVTGGTGFIGSALVRAIAGRGDTVTVLTRGADREHSGVRFAHYSPLDDDDWYRLLEGQDVVLHLAGEQAVGVRYTAAVKQRLYESRVTLGRRLVEAIERASTRPSALISASGVGYYGATLDQTLVDETAGAGSDFLAKLCVDWEAATERASELGVRVVHARMAPVLGKGGGALETMALPFKLFAGGWIASGRQGFSWVHIDDAIRIWLQLIDDSQIGGKVNVTSPHPVSNKQISKALGKQLHRPCWLPVPAAALAAMFGEGAEPLVMGQWAVPKVMQSHGFTWKYPDIEPALGQALSG